MVNHVRTRVNICPNPKCHREIEQLIVVSDVSTIPVERYYACPHCFVELNAYAVAQEEHKGTTIEKYPQDSVSGRAESIRVRDPLDILAPNHRCRRS